MLRLPPLASIFDGFFDRFWAAPSMLLWLPAVALPFLIARWMARPAILVRWGPIDLLARARRRSTTTPSAARLLLLLMRSTLVALTVVAAAQPLLRVAGADRTPASPRVAAAGGQIASRRVLFVVPPLGPTSTAPDASAIELAIGAIRASKSDRPPFQIERVRAADLATFFGPDLPAGSAVGTLIIATDGGLTPAAMEASARALEGGGSLLVLLGPRSAVAATSERLSTWLRAVSGIGIAGQLDGQGARIEVESSLGGIGDALAATAAFVPLPGPSVSGFADLLIDLQPEFGPPRVLARTSPEGRPLIVERRSDTGSVAVVALPCTLGNQASDWSDLAAWPVFVPLVDGLLRRLLDDAAASATIPPRPDRQFGQRRTEQAVPARLLLAAALAIAIAEPVISWWLGRRQTAASHGRTAVSWTSSPWAWLARGGGIAALAALLAQIGTAEAGRQATATPIPIRFLIDISPSMATRDIAPSGSGSAESAAPIGRLAGLVKALAAHPQLGGASSPALRLDVSYATIGPDLRPLDKALPDRLESLATLPPEVDASRLGDAVQAAIETTDPPPAAVIVASDGRITSGASWSRVADIALAVGVPLVAIPLGGEGSPANEFQDDGVTIEAVELPPLAFLGERVALPVSAIGPIHAIDNLLVELKDRDGKAIASGRLRHLPQAAPGEPPRALSSIDWTPTRVGTTSLLAQSGSSGAGTARFAGTTEVIGSPVRVLLIDGRPRFEFRFLEQLLTADRRFQVDSRLLSSATTSAAGSVRGRFMASLPDTVEGWNAYDLVIVGDLTGADLSAGVSSSLLRAARDEGIGLVWMPGRHWAAATTGPDPFDDLVPARPAAGSVMPRPRRLDLLPAGRQSGLVPAAAGAAEAWGGQVFDGIAVTALRPTARWLAVAVADDGDRQPAVILDDVGRAPLLGLLCETWRTKEGTSGGHGDFWRNALLRLAVGHVLARQQPASIAIQPPRPAPGTVIRVDVQQLRPETDLSGWRLQHLRPDGSRSEKTLDARSLRLDPVQPGWHSLAVLPPDDGHSDEPQPICRDFFVPPAALERPGPAADTLGMEAAAIASGGAVVRLDAISSLAQTLARLASVDQSAIDPAGRQTWLIGLLVGAFVAACSIDWALRARRGLP